MRLGKKPATAPRAKSLRHYLRLASNQVPPRVPASMDRSADVAAWPMLDNDTIGDCTIAAVGHAAQLWTAAAGDLRVMTNAEALIGYEAFGYVRGDESTDQGANAQDVLMRWTSPGFECGGAHDVLAGFCALDTTGGYDVMAGIAWLGVVYAGIALPLGVQGADTWDTGPLATPAEGPWAPGSWGGHAVPIIGYDPNGLTVVTWGKTLRMTWPFWRAYADEAYGLLSRDFSSAAIPAEAWAELQADMADLRSAAGA
ncbi:MAG: hypothetical protein ACREFV_08555 [Acetobacteraceae bacterium]